MTKNFSITLVLCPCWGREAPPVAIALLAGNLRSKGYKAHLFDLNNGFYSLVSEKHKRLWCMEQEMFWRAPESLKEMMEQYNAEIEAETKKILEKGSQLVGFSVYSSTLIFTLEIARRIKNYSSDTLIVLGGPHTAEYSGGLELLENPAIDAIVLREGDETLPQMCADLKEKGHFSKIPGLVFKKDGETINGGLREPIKCLDDLPFADYNDFDLAKYDSPKCLNTFASRSCVNKCYFCDERNYFQRFRFRSGENLFEEVKYQLSRFPGVCHFVFNDSVFNGAPQAIRKFSELLLKNNVQITWGGQAIISKTMTPELLRLMAKAGCRLMAYGVESGSNKVLEIMNKKLFTRELAAQVLKNTHEAGIEAHANFMFGYPTETEEDFQETLDFIRQNYKWIDKVNPSQAFTAIPKNTYLYEHAEDFGVEDMGHSLFWSSQEGKNTLPVRLERYERFCRLCSDLGIRLDVTEEKIDKWRLLGEYYQYKQDYEKAVDCYFKDLLKRGYSPESVKNFFECQVLAEGKEENHPLPYQGIKGLISRYNNAIVK